MPAPLAGIHVVEFATAIQGPLAATLLADMGAEVIKIEPPTGDSIRFNYGPTNALGSEVSGSAMFLAANRGKRYLQLNARTPEGLAVIHKLVEAADVFVTNLRDSAMRRLELDYESLKEINPRLIYGSVSGFGHRGPVAQDRMYDILGQARGGLPSVTGRPEDPPTPPGSVIADTGGATVLALGIIAALVARERQGVGQRVDTSGYGTQVLLQSWEITHTGLTGQLLGRDGSYHPLCAGNYGIYATRDGRALAFVDGLTDESFQKFCEFGGISELARDPRFDTMRKRLGLGGAEAARIASEQRPLFERAFASRSLAEWTEFLDAIGKDEAMYQQVFDYDDILNDPQALECGYIVEREISGLGKRRMTGNPISLSETPVSVRTPGGELGQHNEEVLLELGYDWDDISLLREQNQAVIDEAFRE